MPERPLNLAELDERIAIVQDNLRELIEQATAADEERTSQRIADQQAELDLLMKQREELLQPRS